MEWEGEGVGWGGEREWVKEREWEREWERRDQREGGREFTDQIEYCTWRFHRYVSS